jgi:hypothetical protein
MVSMYTVERVYSNPGLEHKEGVKHYLLTYATCGLRTARLGTLLSQRWRQDCHNAGTYREGDGH